MDITLERILSLIPKKPDGKYKHGALTEFAKSIGLAGGNSISDWIGGRSQSYRNYVYEISAKYNVSVEWLRGTTDDPSPRKANQSFNPPTITEDYVTFPVIGDVAAGYDHIAYQDWTEVAIDIPKAWLHGRPITDFFVIKVKGDSMYPDYQDGDYVLILRQSTMDRSGQVGIVRYNEEIATLKRVEYVMGEDWMTLRPINPQFPPITIRDEELTQCTVFGVAKYIIRELRQ